MRPYLQLKAVCIIDLAILLLRLYAAFSTGFILLYAETLFTLFFWHKIVRRKADPLAMQNIIPWAFLAIAAVTVFFLSLRELLLLYHHFPLPQLSTGMAVMVFASLFLRSLLLSVMSASFPRVPFFKIRRSLAASWGITPLVLASFALQGYGRCILVLPALGFALFLSIDSVWKMYNFLCAFFQLTDERFLTR